MLLRPDQVATGPIDLLSLVESMARRARGNHRMTEVKQHIPVAQLPLWDNEIRCMPNEILRSALFNARNKRLRREFMKQAAIAIIGDGRVTYTGEELRQDDETVWLQLLHMARERSVGCVVDFTPYSFCKAIGWAIDGRSYKRLRACLTRLQATALEIHSQRLGEGISLSMIPIFRWWDENTGKALPRYQVTIAHALVKLFEGTNYTRIEWEQRLALPDGIATWLHGYYATHSQPYSINLSTIQKGAGMTTKRAKHVHEPVARALEALTRVGFLESWKIVGELVSVQRTGKRKR